MRARWAEVADSDLEAGALRFVLTGGKSRMEQEHIARIKSHLQHPVIDLSGQLDLLTLAALIAAGAVARHDRFRADASGGALGTPQVALFGPTNPFHWRPRTTPAIVLRAGNAAPVTDFVPQQPPRPMKEISTKQVIDAMQTLLSSSDSASRMSKIPHVAKVKAVASGRPSAIGWRPYRRLYQLCRCPTSGGSSSDWLSVFSPGYQFLLPLVMAQRGRRRFPRATRHRTDHARVTSGIAEHGPEDQFPRPALPRHPGGHDRCAVSAATATPIT